MAMQRYTQPALTAGIMALETFARDLDKELDNLHADLTPRLKSWSGPARTQYGIIQQRWDNQAKENQTQIMRTSVALTNIAQTYRDNENRVTQRWTM